MYYNDARKKEEQLEAAIQHNYPNKRILFDSLDEYTYTLDLMNQFEGLDDKGIYYDYLISRHSSSEGIGLSSPKGYHRFKYRLAIKRLCDDNYRDDFNITLTDLKKGYGLSVIESYIKSILTYEKAYDYHNSRKILTFDEPFLIRGQNKRNRSGYGSVRIRGEVLHEGTKYGETTNYCIFGAIIIA